MLNPSSRKSKKVPENMSEVLTNKTTDSEEANEIRNTSGYTKRPYKKKNVSDVSVNNVGIPKQSGMHKSANMSKIKNNFKSVHGIGHDSDSSLKDINKRPRRAPVTRKVMKEIFLPLSKTYQPIDNKRPQPKIVTLVASG